MLHDSRLLSHMSLLSYPLDAVRSYAGSLTWQPVVRFSRRAVLGLLRRIAVGQIIVTDSDGARIVCGAPQVRDGIPRTELRIVSEAFWVRVLLFADMVSGKPVEEALRIAELSPMSRSEASATDAEVVGLR